MQLPDGLGLLTYSTLVHAGDTWSQMRDSLATYVPEVKARVSPDEPFGVSLRLSGKAAGVLAADPDERASLGDLLDREDLFVYTVNAFPHGPFKGASVMERVYEPDWTTEERATYTCQVADVLADLTLRAGRPGLSPSIQTAPMAFAPKVGDEAYVSRFTSQVLRVVAHLADLEARTGVRVKLAIEPEPACYLETTPQTIAYFERLRDPRSVAELARVARLPLSEAEGALRRYLGVVFDMGHQAVGFEDVRASLIALTEAGVPVFKLQAAAALWVEDLDADVVPALREFTDTIYLSQTTLQQDGGRRSFLTLGEALDAYAGDLRPTELRTHFHVPVFLEEIGPFRTTRPAVQDALRLHRELPLSDHLEIETYTWDVLPEHLKTGSITDYVTRELEFVRQELNTSG
ncbi:hypothetical protein D9V37_17830 [Nocardioides mangrovicus]|uniref:Metabolite traffic protein EboE n=1 Tax=Nocardioides mangrovicus TaxID=2478913 RepID=A0A3L8NXS3_9ACTN|nr:metabolite traffic protein EboE [Nocardioides mangrovicus]RLV47965.1 hypothetical protein D9V37_17830 [Nocardioides mangrovicus]